MNNKCHYLKNKKNNFLFAYDKLQLMIVLFCSLLDYVQLLPNNTILAQQLLRYILVIYSGEYIINNYCFFYVDFIVTF